MDALPPELLPLGSEVGWGAVVIGIVIMLFRGTLVTRREADQIVRDRDTWREAHKESERARESQRESLITVIELAETTHKMIEALPKKGGSRDEDEPG